MRMVADVFHLRGRIHGSSGHVARVFQAHQGSLRIVINLRPDDRLDLLPRQNPVFSPGHSGHAPGNRRHRRQLIQIHVAPLFANHFVAVMGPYFNADEVPHAPRGNKQRRLFPKNLRRPPLQSVDRRIFAVNVIPDLRLGHRPSHLRRRPRNRVAPQVHYPRRNFPAVRQLIRIHPLIPLCHRVTHILLMFVRDLLFMSALTLTPSERPLCQNVVIPHVLYLLCPTPILSFREQRGICFSLPSPLCQFFFFPHSAFLRFLEPPCIFFSCFRLSYLKSSTNTSFETLSLSGASRTTLPFRSTKPADANGSNRPASTTP